MASVNKVIIVGNLGRDPETRTFPNGGQVTNIRIATTDKWRDKNTGENKEATEWHSVVFHQRLAEIASQYLRKGSQVYVEGSLRTRKWTDQSGQERYITEIRADSLQMLGGRQGSSSNGGEGGGYQPRQSAAQAQGNAPAPERQRNAAPQEQVQQPPDNNQNYAGSFDDMDDDIPF